MYHEKSFFNGLYADSFWLHTENLERLPSKTADAILEISFFTLHHTYAGSCKRRRFFLEDKHLGERVSC